MSILNCHKCNWKSAFYIEKNYFVILWVFVIFSRARVQFWQFLDLKQNIYFTRSNMGLQVK